MRPGRGRGAAIRPRLAGFRDRDIYRRATPDPVDEGEIPVVSSNIATVRYVEDGRTLWVRFHSGRVYCYLGVPRAEYGALMQSNSHGKCLHARIIPKFKVVEAGQ